MSQDGPTQVTQALDALSRGDSRAIDRLLPLVYDELRRVAASYLKNEPQGAALQATAIVHEAFIKLCGQRDANWNGKTHFFAVSAQAMRRILVDQARGRSREKRGGDWQRIELRDDVAISDSHAEDILDLDEALEELNEFDSRMAQIVELRFFGGLTMQEVADQLGVSKGTVEGDWTVARAWLRRQLSNKETPPASNEA